MFYLRTISALVSTALFVPFATNTLSAQVPVTKGEMADSSSVQQAALVESLRDRLINLGAVNLMPLSVASPGVSASTPAARSFSGATLGVWMSFQARARYTRNPDGAVGMGIGLGSPKKLRYQAGVAVLDLGIRNGEAFGSRGSFNFRVTKSLPRGYGLSAGVENALIWGWSDAPTSGFLVVSNSLPLRPNHSGNFAQLAWSVGVGSGRYRTEDDVWAGRGTINLFGSIGTRIAKPASMFMEWSGQDANAGVSFTPFRTVPFAMTWTLVDLLGSAGDGARLTVGAGYRFTL